MQVLTKITVPLVFSYLSLLSKIESSLPSVDFYPEHPEEWKAVFLKNTTSKAFYSIFTANHLSIYTLYLNCRAPYPVVWNISGFIHPTALDQIAYPRQTNASYQISVYTKQPILQASLKVSCQGIKNSNASSEIFVFVHRTTKEKSLVAKTSSVMDSKIIPCQTTNPTKKVQLYKMNSTETGHTYRRLSKQYDPTIGFISDYNFDGTYICEQESDFVPIQASTTSKPLSDNYTFSPDSVTIRVFDETGITLDCSSWSGKPVKIVVLETHKSLAFERGTKIELQTIKNNETSVRNTIKMIYQVRARNHVIVRVFAKLNRNMISVSGKAICITDSINGTYTVLKQWSMEFITTPELHLNNYFRRMECRSKNIPLEIQSVRCEHSLHCRYIADHCPGNVANCNFETRNPNETNCFQYDSRFCKKSAQICVPCGILQYSHFHGLVTCSVNGKQKQWEFFESLGYHKYVDWRQAPKDELIKMNEVPSILYANQTSRFVCEALKYFFPYSLKFEIQYRNGTMSLLKNDGSTVTMFQEQWLNHRSIYGFSNIAILDIKLHPGAVGIRCVAQWWNSTDVLRTLTQFEIRYLSKPQFEDGSSDLMSNVTFFVGDRNNRLTCLASGEPQVHYEWHFNGTKASEFLSELKTSMGSDGENYLDFPQIGGNETTKYVGVYTCTASNKLGKVEKLFHLSIAYADNSHISSEKRMYKIIYATTSSLVVAFSIVFAVLIVFIRRYKNAKQLLRNLTDAEIDEFFEGRLDGVGNSATNVETLDLLPYDKKFEIHFDDLKFDITDNCILGSGEFGMVVRGFIISKSKPVALKISKKYADITIFKSLLSEVKIMIYIGHHENVNSLIGVCTDGIRERNGSIYVATEICELGSLKNFLKKWKESFVNLINDNQEIDLSWQSKSLPRHSQVTTLDLISFSAQIAKGMEFLASKSVIHADLASRNVLVANGLIAKITDFGLSKKIYENNNYVKKSKVPLPWRWMAPESLKTLTFSTSSDVWAYGVTLFEIFTLGDAPFPNEEWNMEFVGRLEDGLRMGMPQYSSKEISLTHDPIRYSNMVTCWENEPQMRPSFSALKVFFEELLNKFGYHKTAKEMNKNSRSVQICGSDIHNGTCV